MMRRAIAIGLILTGTVVGEEGEANVSLSPFVNEIKSGLPAEVKPRNIYERTCIPCHRYLPVSLEQMFMRYLKTFSGEKTLKTSLKVFLKTPMEETSVMTDLFIDRFSVKDKSLLSDKQLDEAIDIYWDLYNVRNKLK
jgi:hypothetical protein